MMNGGSFQKRTLTHTQRKFLLSRKGAGEVSGEERAALLIFSVGRNILEHIFWRGEHIFCGRISYGGICVFIGTFS